jgi:hypothetical protein
MSPVIGRAGYTRLNNPKMKDGRWKKDGVKFVLYIKVGAVPPDDILGAVNGTPF